MKKLSVFSFALLSTIAACGDNYEGNITADTGPPPVDASPDTPDDTGPDPFTFAAPSKLSLPGTGPDQIQTIIAGPAGTAYFYYAGFVAETA